MAVRKPVVLVTNGEGRGRALSDALVAQLKRSSAQGQLAPSSSYTKLVR